MIIVIITTFTDSLLKAKLIPISKLDFITHILLVCDVKGPDIDKVKYIIPPSWSYKLFFHKSFAKLFSLILTIKKYNPRFIMAYNVFPHGVNGWIASKLYKIPIIQQFPGSYAELTVSKEISDNSLVKNLPGLSKIIEKINCYVVKKSTFIMVPGRKTRKYIIENLNVDKEKIFLIHDTIDLTIYKAKNVKKDFDLILAARLTGLKRIDIFINTVKILSNNYPEIRVAILGHGEKMNELQSLSSKLGLTNNIVFTGFQNHPEKYYQRSKLFILTSATEGISTASMEAMVCGLPVVVSDVGDMSEIVINGETGYLIQKFHKPEEFAKKITKILNSKQLYNKMSHNCISTIKNNYTFEHAVKFWESFTNTQFSDLNNN